MKILVRHLSDYAGEILKRSRTGAVHSVYRKTINLLTEGGLLALQAAGSPLSPISLVTGLSSEGMEALGIEPGSPVALTRGSLRLSSPQGEHLVYYREAARHNLLLRGGLEAGQCQSLTKDIKAALLSFQAGGFDSIFNGAPEQQLSLVLLTAKKRMEKSLLLYRGGKLKESASELSRLLGLGLGLTPSGDDFLCGTLAGLCLSGMEDGVFAQALKEEIRARLADTIDISAAFLSCALDGQYSLAVNSLQSLPGPEQIAGTFSKIGHSSGADTLCGILYTLSLAK